MRVEPKFRSQDAPQLIYGLEAKPPFPLQLVYALQWVSFTLGIILVTTAIVGPGVGLSPREVVDFGGRVLVVTGLATILQSYFGHRLPIIEGPGVIYWATYLFTAERALSQRAILSDIEGGMLVAGITVVLFVVSGLARQSVRLFTPALSGVTLILISLSFLTGSASRLIGVSPLYPHGNVIHFTTVGLVIVTGALTSVVGRGVLRTIPILFTVGLSYLVSALFGQVDFTMLGEVGFLAIPRPLAGGLPTFRPEIGITYAIVGLLATVNTFAAVEASAALCGQSTSPQRHRSGILVTGVSQILAGLGAAVGTTSFAASTVVVSLSRVGARSTVSAAGLIMFLMGFIPWFSALLFTVPLPIVNGVFFLISANLFSLGLDQFARIQFDTRLRLVVGLSLSAGLAVTYMSPTLFEAIPYGGSFLLSNPIIVGTGCAFFVEHVLFAKLANVFEGKA